MVQKLQKEWTIKFAEEGIKTTSFILLELEELWLFAKLRNIFSSQYYIKREYRPTTWAFLLGPAGGNSLLFLSPKATHKNLTYYLEYFIRMKWEFNQATKSKNVWNNQFKKLKFYAGQINWNVMQDNTLLIEKLKDNLHNWLIFVFSSRFSVFYQIHVPLACPRTLGGFLA